MTAAGTDNGALRAASMARAAAREAAELAVAQAVVAREHAKLRFEAAEVELATARAEASERWCEGKSTPERELGRAGLTASVDAARAGRDRAALAVEEAEGAVGVAQHALQEAARAEAAIERLLERGREEAKGRAAALEDEGER